MQKELKNIFVAKEVAKLAKEKGFDEICAAHYKEYGYNDSENCMPNTYQDFFELDSCDNPEGFIEAPTHFQLIQWLEGKNICVWGDWKDEYVVQKKGDIQSYLDTINDALIWALNLIKQ